jgi:hypothetical protein
VYEYTAPVKFAPVNEDVVLRSFSLEKTDITKFIREHAKYVLYHRRRLPKFNVKKLSGTILIKGGTYNKDPRKHEDHFLSFRIKGTILKVFDPADVSGRYDSYFPKSYQKMLSLITGKRVVVSDRHPQCAPGDTFCQTWTLARLDSNLKPYTRYTPRKTSPKKTKIETSTRLMYEIVSKITHSSRFVAFFSRPGVRSEFGNIFEESRRYYKLPIAVDSVDYFIALSRKIKPRHIASIMRGD